MKIISGILILFSVYIGISHGMRVFTKPTEVYLNMMQELGINEQLRIAFGIWSITCALLILFPKTFFFGNLLRAVQLVLMISLVLKVGNYKFALVEVPFLLVPLVLIYLGHPLKSAFA